MNNKVSTLDQQLFNREKLNCLELSPKELSIARLLAWGYIQKEIARSLHISPLTVSVHLRKIYKQLHIHKETDLTRWYIFKEYCINDNPFKKIVAVLFLIFSLAMIFNEHDMMRPFRSRSLKTACRLVVKPLREKQFKNVFELKYVTA